MANELIPLPAVLQRYARSKSATYSDIKIGHFPPPVKLGAASAWPAEECDIVAAARTAAFGDEAVRALVVDLVAARYDVDPSAQRKAVYASHLRRQH
jgi:prophage regulatory protein